MLLKKINNEVKNIFLHDNVEKFKNFSPNNNDISDVVVIAKKRDYQDRKMFLFNGQIISSKKQNRK